MSKWIIKDQKTLDKISKIITDEIRRLYGEQYKNYKYNIRMPLEYAEIHVLENEDWKKDKLLTHPLKWVPDN